MHYLIVYNSEEAKEFEEWKLAIKNSSQFYYVLLDDNGMGFVDFKIEEKIGDNVYHVLEESEALKYYGGSALYLNEIYCTEKVDVDKIKKLYWTCVRKHTPFRQIGLSEYRFKCVIGE